MSDTFTHNEAVWNYFTLSPNCYHFYGPCKLVTPTELSKVCVANRDNAVECLHCENNQTLISCGFSWIDTSPEKFSDAE